MRSSPSDQLTVPIWSPLHRRIWLISPRQYRLMVRLLNGRTFRQRELAAETGYSISGLHDALESLVTGGVLAKRAIVGRLGRTWAKVRAGAYVAQNVRQQGGDGRENRTVMPPNVFGFDPRSAWTPAP